MSLGYLESREKPVEILYEPDIAAAYLYFLSNLLQTCKESILNDMIHARFLVIKAHFKFAHPDNESIVVTSFLLGSYNRQLGASLAVVKI